MHQKCIKSASKVHQKCIMFLTMFKHFSEKASLDRWKNKIPLWNWKWSKGLTKTSWLHPFKPAKGLQRFHPDLLQNFLMRKKMPQESMSFLLSWVLKQASLQTPWANFYVIWSRFVASIPELRRLGLTKTSWLYPFKPAKGLQGFHPDLLQFFWWDKKVPLESMSFLSNWVLKQACLQFPWTIFFYLWDFTKFHLPKKISRFFFANVNALQWLLKVKIQCKFFLWLHLYLCKSSLYVHMLLLHQVGPKGNSIHIYIYIF